jgi:hypothetical protein
VAAGVVATMTAGLLVATALTMTSGGACRAWEVLESHHLPDLRGMMTTTTVPLVVVVGLCRTGIEHGAGSCFFAGWEDDCIWLICRMLGWLGHCFGGGTVRHGVSVAISGWVDDCNVMPMGNFDGRLA